MNVSVTVKPLRDEHIPNISLINGKFSSDYCKDKKFNSYLDYKKDENGNEMCRLKKDNMLDIKYFDWMKKEGKEYCKLKVDEDGDKYHNWSCDIFGNQTCDKKINKNGKEYYKWVFYKKERRIESSLHKDIEGNIYYDVTIYQNLVTGSNYNGKIIEPEMIRCKRLVSNSCNFEEWEKTKNGNQKCKCLTLSNDDKYEMWSKDEYGNNHCDRLIQSNGVILTNWFCDNTKNEKCDLKIDIKGNKMINWRLNSNDNEYCDEIFWPNGDYYKKWSKIKGIQRCKKLILKNGNVYEDWVCYIEGYQKSNQFFSINGTKYKNWSQDINGIIQFDFDEEFTKVNVTKFNKITKNILIEYFEIFKNGIDLIKLKKIEEMKLKEKIKLQERQKRKEKRRQIKEILELNNKDIPHIDVNYLDEYYEQIINLGNIEFTKESIKINSIAKRETIILEEQKQSPKWKQVVQQKTKRPQPISRTSAPKPKTTSKSKGPSQQNGPKKNGKQNKVTRVSSDLVQTYREDPIEKFKPLKQSSVTFEGSGEYKLSHQDWNDSVNEQNKLIINESVSIHNYDRNKYLYDAHNTKWSTGNNCVRDHIKSIVSHFRDPNNLILFVMTGYGNGILRKELASWRKTYQINGIDYCSDTSKVFDENGSDREDMVVLHIRLLY